MSKIPKRVCRFAEFNNRDVDLSPYAQIIIDTINETVPGKNPEVYKDCFVTDPLTHWEAIHIGQALSSIPELACFGKEVKIFRLFSGKNIEVEEEEPEVDDVSVEEKPQQEIIPKEKPKKSNKKDKNAKGGRKQ